MKELRRNIRLIGTLLVVIFIITGGAFGYTVYTQGSRWMTNQYNTRLNNAKSTVVMGSIVDRNGVVLASTNSEGERVYSSSKSIRRAMSQTVGDPLSMSGTGVETFHSGTLLGFSGSIIDRAAQWYRGDEFKGDNIMLTVDAKLTEYISGQFPDGYQGAVVVLNYKTGEILSMVSKPDYDPARVDARNIDSEGSGYLNRCLQGLYTPGSVFKIVTLNAALSNIPGVTNQTFTCTGEAHYGDTVVRCIGGTAHGEITLAQAVAKSCNVTFAALSYEVGNAAFLSTAQSMGFNTNFRFQDIVLYNSVLPTDISSGGELAWSGVGQGRIQVTPLHMAMITGGIANGGTIMEPRLIRQTYGATSISRKNMTSSAFRTGAVSASAAEITKQYMRLAVTGGTASNAAVKGYNICGKTGSAEVSDDKSVNTHAWFVGFIDDPDYPYAVAVVVEHGGAGSDKAAKLASRVFKKVIELT